MESKEHCGKTQVLWGGEEGREDKLSYALAEAAMWGWSVTVKGQEGIPPTHPFTLKSHRPQTPHFPRPAPACLESM